ncbi:hypothetical protein [Actinomadura atramentaria]|uniref:hypothetical protein n=1 Tax=Actinomadura atramentaria TaxID=1990 RepID=UPI00037C3030|nr:hypothetical protein [Actinomadura atramentaria]
MQSSRGVYAVMLLFGLVSLFGSLGLELISVITVDKDSRTTEGTAELHILVIAAAIAGVGFMVAALSAKIGSPEPPRAAPVPPFVPPQQAVQSNAPQPGFTPQAPAPQQGQPPFPPQS